mgnify:CR=1 FL=1
MEREQLEAAIVDLDVQLVDRRVAHQHPLDEREVALDEAVRTRSSARPPISSSRPLR